MKGELANSSFLTRLINEGVNMNSREILLYYALKFKGDWNKIYDAIQSKLEIDPKEAEKIIKENQNQYITFLDSEYPETLRHTFKPPFVLFYQGDISLISDENNKMAVVGSRKYSEYGKEMTEKLVKGISKDFVIVSGLALGIDAIAHRSAIESGGKTIAILGNGIEFHYLEENKDIYEEIRKNHLILSEYPGKEPPKPEYFPVRNRIIAGLCNSLLVTEGKVRSGTQISALLMAQKSGDVCCVPSRAGEDSVCNYLIKEGAFLVETPEDIYECVGVTSRKPVFEK